MIQQSFKNNKATLYLVATPIGNLSEMTPRGIEILNAVDIIAAEDTRNSIKLCQHFNIKTPLIAYHDFNEEKASDKLIAALEANKDIALISDAGYPLISDPGHDIVNKALEYGFNVVPVSGSSAFINALVASGIVAHPFAFMGFLDSKESSLKKQLNEDKDLPLTLIYYVSVHKLEKSLKIMYDIFGNRQICLAREITKKHEEFIRGSILEVMQEVETLKGEFVLVIDKGEQEDEINLEDLVDTVQKLVQKGTKKSQAIAQVAKENKISKNELYDAYHRRGRI